MDEQEKNNVCPVCSKGFSKISSLRQHVTKSHKKKVVDSIIEEKAQRLQSFDQSQPSSQRSSEYKLQVIVEDPNSSTGKSFHQFDIVENNASGECLFVAVLEYLQGHQHLFSDVPSDAQELRARVVDHIVTPDNVTKQSNFGRFGENIMVNLQKHVRVDKDASEELWADEYARYMSLPRTYGTTSELCALAEIFNFSFCVVQKDNDADYSCFDYGSMDRFTSHRTNAVVSLLFTGNPDSGHFRLLAPNESSVSFTIPTGSYKRIMDYTTSRLTSICPLASIPSFNIEPPPHHNTDDNSTALDASFEDFAILLARCKSNVRVLKRIPRGARILAAKKLSNCVEQCLVNPGLAQNWKSLLTFAYTSLRVPEKTNNVSLATLVKRNIDKSELIFTKRVRKKVPISLSKRVEYKIAEGDIKGAVRLLSSTDSLAPQDAATFEQLKQKHPPPSREMRFPDPPSKDIEPLVVSERDIFYSIRSFPNGSGSGIDGILPQHLKDLTLPSTGEAGQTLIKSLTALSNYLLSGRVQSEFIKIMYGAALCALDKKTGGVRPIAVGNTFRRITSKLASASVRAEMSSKFAPRQVGFGVKGGCEAAVHATRTFIKKNAHRKVVVVKIDFRNAFNEVDRDAFLNEMKVNCPAIFPYLWQCYSTPTLLFYGDYILLSQNGAQQGDPCGPLAFSSAIQFAISALVSEFIVFYLDDGTIAGEYESVLQDFKTIIVECEKVGLHINPSKCELFFVSEVDQNIVSKFDKLSPGICVINELTLLGAPITDNAFDIIFNEKSIELKLLFERLVEMDNFHIAFYILKNCFAIPKLVFLLRTSPTWNHKRVVDELDDQIKSALEALTNSELDNNTWIMASLPINSGGIGVRRVRDIALPAFLSSVNANRSLVSIMLHQSTLQVEEIADYRNSLSKWNQLHPESVQPTLPSLQKHWNAIVITDLLNSLQFENDTDLARVMAVQRTESGAWLHALPSKSIGTLLDNNAFRIIIGLRLGVDICAPHICLCGSQVDKKGRHGLKCRKSAGRHARHAEINAIIRRALVSADVPAKLEPAGLAREDGKRVDGMSLIPWTRGATLIWDATCTDTFAPSNMKFSSKAAGRAAENAAQAKKRKYQSLISQNYHFVPFAVETMGPWSEEAIEFFEELSKRIALKTNEPRSKSFLKQRLSMAIQRGNAAAVMGTFRSCDSMEEIFYLL